MTMTDTATAPRTPLAVHRRTLQGNLDLLRRLTADVDDDAARVPIVAGGSHFAWLLAHLIVSRDGILGRLGAERVWDDEARKRYGHGSDAGAVDYPPMADLLALLSLQGERIDAALASEPTLAGDALDRIDFMVWHETYHLGQATLYRRAAGLTSPIG
jgi:hypothetical protein